MLDGVLVIGLFSIGECVQFIDVKGCCYIMLLIFGVEFYIYCGLIVYDVVIGLE